MAPASDSKHIRKAYLTSMKEGVVELQRDWRATRMPPISMEGKLHGYLSLYPLPASEFGEKSGYFVDETNHIVFVFYPEKYSKIEYKGASIYVAGGFNGWQDAVGKDEWELVPERVGGRRVLALRKDLDSLSPAEGSQFKFVTDRHHWFLVDMSAPNLAQDGMGNWNYAYSSKVTGRHRLGFVLKSQIDFSENNSLLYHTRKGVERANLNLGDFFLGLKSDKELGAIPQGKRVTFRLFAPRAKWVKVGFFEDLDQPEKVIWVLMKRGEDFVWEATVEQDLRGWYYWFRLDGPKNEFSLFDPNFKVLDPYARAAIGREGPGIVVDDSRHGRPPHPFSSPQWQDLVVLEGHVRDFTQNLADLPAEEGKPRGFSDLAAYAKRKDFYPKRLGVNAIELQPIQENDSQSYDEYHWGYMTANFFAPHSGYAKAPEKASQVDEFKELVSTLHGQGFAVILDVVYNHVGEPAHLMFIDKLYYFHVGADGSLSNWSGCGNDFRSDAPMARRIIVDSLKHLVSFYGVDGFRFDLADLVGKPALEEVERELKAIRPDIILIAEPWSFRGHIGPELRDTGYASWNDGYREFLKRFVRGGAGMPEIQYFTKGSPIHYATWPAQTINYVESHDDRVWIDDVTEHGGFDGTYPTHHDIARTRLMIATLMMSIGMPMLHAGMDFLGTKNGVRNTYQDGPRNALDYKRALQYPNCARYFADWVRFRLSSKGELLRHYNRASDAFFEFIDGKSSGSYACIYNAKGEWGDAKLLFAINPGLGPVEIELGKWAELAWRQIADHERFHDAKDETWANRVDKRLFLPPLSCGLWEKRS
ncbi:alpha-amylase family glycosyl hydrolase [Pelagicoccus sp. SDUM812003]|uniref:alpha-amylase family glycosyl hydrolase n=1 Tax=Pelagicoccus sp. SDUM812003 TaxID=3041267 RepID=UPI00281010F7|nr:alpha-amylase family glycosyl hydrolase [Pelagicoccus sp. SDUM812003]MDQ8202718.1 alpha-amylase family glycosyl hydrolase [Pelagicoccus sp. SDUM812003]